MQSREKKEERRGDNNTILQPSYDVHVPDSPAMAAHAVPSELERANTRVKSLPRPFALSSPVPFWL